ncbi:MAG TPA: hypothetical protein VL357_07090 [Rariglobus sp.]|nr:hypothetical protein [Rariglobus sp.]
MDIHVSRFYAEAVAEVVSGKVDADLEARAYIESDCDLAKTKSRYLIFRAEQLKRESDAEIARHRKDEQTVRMAEWNQNRYKISRRRVSSCDDEITVPAVSASTTFVVRRKSYLGGLAALFDWVAR